ncbi:MAG: fliD [Herminiimonas sp.]|nr:fliD [Herminiimonas sp.]
MAISSPGIGSNLDVNGIVTKLMQVESQPLTNLARKEASYQAKLSAYGNLGSALGSLQGALSGLSTSALFNGVSAVPADASIFTASGNSQAVPGTYQVQVTQLAQAQTISTAGQASTSATIGANATTTLSFQFGTIAGGTLANGAYTGASFTQDASRTTGTVTIDASNNSLQGIRDAVNAANIGVTATIVADGSATPHHLVFTSAKTGATSSMSISVSGDATLQNLLAYNPAATQNMTQSSAAQSTLLTVNGIAVSSATASVADAVQGVTLNITKIGSSNLTVSRNTSAVQTAVSGFVKAYNEFNTTLNSLSGYNAASGQAGPLIGDATVRTIQAQVRKTLGSSLAGLNSGIMTLPQIGVAFQKDGTLALDSAKLQAAMTSNYEDIGALFATFGKATDSLVNFTSSTTSTKAGNYPVTVTALATKGELTGDKNLNSASTTIAAGTTLNVSVDGASATIGLAAGTYTAAQLASLVQSAINGSSTLSAAGSAVTATINGSGFINIQSNQFGSSSKVSVSSSTGTAASAILGATPVADVGVDVNGTIGGMTALGSGQFLSAAAGSDAQGLKLEITGGAIGGRGTLDFSQGYADRLSKLIDGFLGSSGMIAGGKDGLSRGVKDIGKAREAMQLRLTEVEKRYRAQFTALDVAIGNMSTTSSFLTQQLAQLSSQSS